jgi:hypothetical protein
MIKWGDKLQKSIPRSKIKKPADDVPSWARGNRPYNRETPNDFAKRVMDDQYGVGKWDGKNSEYSQIKKWGSRHFEPSEPPPEPPAWMPEILGPGGEWIPVDPCVISESGCTI